MPAGGQRGDQRSQNEKTDHDKPPVNGQPIRHAPHSNDELDIE
jgi:hypothetical protein